LRISGSCTSADTSKKARQKKISKEDTADFDNDLELAKTIGTPAFFAP
jgi:hypothetical protein